MTREHVYGTLFYKDVRIWCILSVGADEAVGITRKFFQLNYSSVDITDKVLREDIWFVKASLSLFGQHSSRTLSIESRTGRIISCE